MLYLNAESQIGQLPIHMQVEEITLMNTIFIKWDGSRILCPNAKLSIDMLTNVTRSQKKGESFKVCAGFQACQSPGNHSHVGTNISINGKLDGLLNYSYDAWES